MKQRIVVIDFETTGLSARGGDRAIEVGAVAIEDGRIGATFQTLINPGRQVDSFIESYTGISNSMLAEAPNGREVFPELHEFVGDAVLVAHNASFDQNFLDAEYQRVDCTRQQPFLCSMRVARRLYPDAPNHKLGTLVDYANVPITGTFHRALADAEMTALLWLAMLATLRDGFGLEDAPLELLQKLQSVAIARADDWLAAKAAE
ncbi:PolC-type DNA polymerase III [Candidatus Litorirhabdus singularis]|uniref:3'-5' exonuclease n=1 Tax=Candidatus Litorirhabdus singularis TaxID=2518993 RepID=UPI00242C1128|nr:3'-5' exonuclease [Candidatus Litorirhabdus singularis]